MNKRAALLANEGVIEIREFPRPELQCDDVLISTRMLQPAVHTRRLDSLAACYARILQISSMIFDSLSFDIFNPAVGFSE
jgi:hypothetical protein